jgi:hypothetical protein
LKDRYFELKNLIGAILLLSVVVTGCKQGDQTLGIDLLPGIKVLYTGLVRDSTTISTTIITDPKIRVDQPVYDLLGSFNDPVFGRTDASFAAQFRLPYNPAYPKTSALDSIILSMSYKKLYGDTTEVSRQTLNIYELTGSLNYRTIYKSSFDLKSLVSSELIGTGSFYPKFRTDSLKTDTTLQVIRVRLDPSFGNKLLGIDSLKMTSNDEFLKYFKGLYIQAMPINRKGALVSINTAASEIMLYYHDEKSDTLGFYYRTTANSANVASFSHDYTRARFYSNLNKEKNLDTLIYVQPTAGIKSKILVPSLSTWKDSVNYSINEATLIFHADTIMSDYRRYSMPPRLYLMRDSTDTELFPADAKISSAYYGGYYDHSSATYIFNVTQYLQNLVVGLRNGTMKNEGFYLVPSDRIGSAQRVVLKGFGSSQPVKLAITYTRNK